MPVAIPFVLMIVVVGGLFAVMIMACMRFTKGPVSVVDMKDYLIRLQKKFIAQKAINPEQERIEMEKLQNKIKGSCDRGVISSNGELKDLFGENCASIRAIMAHEHIGDKMAWLKFRELMFSFNSFYFQPVVQKAVV